MGTQLISDTLTTKAFLQGKLKKEHEENNYHSKTHSLEIEPHTYYLSYTQEKAFKKSKSQHWSELGIKFLN